MERCCREIDLFLYPTEFGREKHLEAGLPGPVGVLPNFVPDRLLPSPGPGEGFLYVGRLEEEKGVEDLIPVFERLPDHRLTIVGKGALASKLSDASAGLPNVELSGYIAPEKL
jgi:glycosyltransferase involved in cell wall biosynthesis